MEGKQTIINVDGDDCRVGVDCSREVGGEDSRADGHRLVELFFSFFGGWCHARAID